jgi:hypothetical protein
VVVTTYDPPADNVIGSSRKLRTISEIFMVCRGKITNALYAIGVLKKSSNTTAPGYSIIVTKQKAFEAGCATNVTGRWVPSTTTLKPYKEL